MHRIALALTALLLCSAAPSAQISVGAGGYSLDYAPGGGDAVYTFDSDVYAVGFYGASGLFHAFYGTDVQPTVTAGDSTEATALGVDLASAGAIDIVRLGENVEVSLFVPIGIELGYRNLTVETVSADGAPSSDNDGRSLHLALAALRAGGGVAATVPLTGFPLARSLQGSASLTLGAGAQADFDPVEAGNQIGGEGEGLDAYGLRTSTLSLQVQLDGILGGDLGAIVGYTLRTSRTDEDTIEAVADVLDAVTGGGEYAQFERLHLARFGLVF